MPYFFKHIVLREKKKKERKWHRCLLKQSFNGLFFSIIVTILRKWTSYMVMYDVCLLKCIFFFLFFFSQKGESHKMLIVVERKSYKSDKDSIQNHFTLRIIRDELSYCRITMLAINWKDYRKNQFPILVNKLLLWIVLLVPGKEKGVCFVMCNNWVVDDSTVVFTVIME